MEILPEIIQQMSREEARHYKLLANRMQYGHDRKDISLFDYIRSNGKSFDEEKIFKKLYVDGDKNAFYRLKHRLLKDIQQSLLLLQDNPNDAPELYRLVSLAEFFSSRTQFSIALYFLKRAEKKALSSENYSLLDHIYGLFITVSQEITHEDPMIFVKKRRENRQRLDLISEMDELLAVASYRVRVGQGYASADDPEMLRLRQLAEEISTHPALMESRQLQLRICMALCQLFIMQHDYEALQEYLEQIYQQFDQQKYFDKKTHELKLKLLTYLVNSSFKNHQYKSSLEYAESLRVAINDHGKSLHDRFLFFYYNSLVINYSVLDKDKAIATLEELQKNKSIGKNPFYEQFVYANLALLWFEKGNHDKAIRQLMRLYTQENYERMDQRLKMKISIAELIIRFDSGDIENFQYKYKQYEKDFAELLKEDAHLRDDQMLNLLDKMSKKRGYRRDASIVEQVKKFLENSTASSAESEIIKYDAWLSEHFRMSLKY